MPSLQTKLTISLGSAALFVLINLPATYRLTNQLLGGLVGPLYSNGCPTMLGMAVHAGHGLDYHNVGAVVAVPEIEELNIGHAIVSRAIFVGLDRAIRDMLAAMGRL